MPRAGVHSLQWLLLQGPFAKTWLWMHVWLFKYLRGIGARVSNQPLIRIRTLCETWIWSWIWIFIITKFRSCLRSPAGIDWCVPLSWDAGPQLHRYSVLKLFHSVASSPDFLESLVILGVFSQAPAPGDVIVWKSWLSLKDKSTYLALMVNTLEMWSECDLKAQNPEGKEKRTLHFFFLSQTVLKIKTLVIFFF